MKNEIIKLENENEINLSIIKDMLKIQIKLNSKEYIGIFSLNYLQKDIEIFSLLGIEGIRDFINQRIIKKEYTLIFIDNNLILTLLFSKDKDKKIKLIIPFNDNLREISIEKIIKLETEFVNLKNKMKGMKLELKNELKEEIMKNVKKELLEIEKKRPKILFHKKYLYSSSILIHDTTLTEIPFYTNEFITEQIYNIIQVNINIPFT